MSEPNPNEPGWLEGQLLILVDLLAILPGILALGGEAEAGRGEMLRQAGMRLHRPSLLSSSDLSELVRRGTIPVGAYEETLARSGFSDGTIEQLRKLIPTLLDVQTLAELTRRGLMSEEDYGYGLQHLGYTPEQVHQLEQLRFYIPGPQDVISFANRDVYYPDVVAAYGMDQDFPEAMIPDLERAGVARETALKFWEAHWSLPSMPLAFEMYQRTAETGLTRADMMRLMRSAGIEPYWREKILAVSFSPFTRVDIRRMNKAGVLNEQEVTQAYKAIGYDDVRADKLTAFTLKLNGATENQELAPFRTKMRTHVETLFLDGVIDVAELDAQFTVLGYTPAEAVAFVAEAEFIKHATDRKIVREAIRKAYEGGHITDQDATARLVADGYTPDEAARIMVPWHIVRELHDLSAHEHAARELTRADVLAAYEDHIIDKPAAVLHLKQLKYHDADIETAIALADFKTHKADRTAAEHVQHSLFMARRATDASVAKGLTEAGVAPERIAKLQTEWDAELAARTPTLSKAEVAHAVAQGFIEPADGVHRLQALGYSHADVTIIVDLASKGVIVV